VVFAFSACGGGGSDSTQSQTTGTESSEAAESSGSTADAAESKGSTATGSPIKIGHISDATGVVAYPQVSAAVRGAVRGVNERGGLDGHPLELDTCDGASEINKDVACARQMVSDGVVAMVGSSVPIAEPQVVSILSAAKIPQIGTNGYATALSDPYNFLLAGSQVAENAAEMLLLKTLGVSKVGEMRLELPVTDEYMKLNVAAAEILGFEFVNDVKVPPTQADASPSASALLEGDPEVINTNSSGPPVIQISRALQQLGFEGNVLAFNGDFTSKDISSLEPVMSSLILFSPFPPIGEVENFPELQQFLDDMAAEKESGDSDAPTSDEYADSLSINAWLSVIALQKVAGEAKATTKDAIDKAFKDATNVELELIPPWTPNKSAIAGSSYTRISNPFIYAQKFEDGKLVLQQPKPIDTSKLLEEIG
jgi:branched-chain amino acid transport system substrate-binding protein